MNSVLPQGKNLYVRGNSNTGTGGSIVDVTSQLCPSIVQDCIDATRILGLRMAGVDILSSDLSQPLMQVGGVILEVNSTPGIGGHREYTSVNSGKKILCALFGL